MILAHTDVDQLIRLCIKLVDYGDVYIHVDKKTDNTYLDHLTNYIESHDLCRKINVLKDRCYITWGGYSSVNAITKLLEFTLNNNECSYDRIFFISGLCYPLLSPSKLFDFCDKNKDKELLMAYNISRGNNSRQLEKVTLYHFFRNIHLPHKSIVRRGIIGGTKLLLKYLQFRKKPYLIVNKSRWDVFFSAEWVSLTDSCWRFVLENLQHNKSLVSYFQHTYCADEMIIATIVMNSEYGKNAFTSQEPYIENLSMLHYLHYTDHIWTYDENDFEELMRSGKPFVRKLVSGKSEKLIEMINNLHEQEKR